MLPRASLIQRGKEKHQVHMEETPTQQAQPTPEAALDAQPQVSGGNAELIRFAVDGQEIEVTLDELKRRASHASGAAKRMQEAAQIRKQSEEQVAKLLSVFETLKANPSSFIELGKKLGVPVEELARDLVIQEMNLKMMDPSERELHDTKQENSRLKAQFEKENAVREEQRASQAYQQSQQQIFEEYSGFLNAKNIVGEQNRARVIKHMTEYVLDGLNEGRGMMPLEQAYNRYLREYGDDSWQSKAVEALKNGTLNLDEDVMKLIRQRDIDAFKKTAFDRQRGPQPKPKQTSSTPKKKSGMSIDDFFERGWRK